MARSKRHSATSFSGAEAVSSPSSVPAELGKASSGDSSPIASAASTQRTSGCTSQYEELLQRVLNQGARRADRTGTGTIGLFATQSRYSLVDSFPLITSKRVFWKGVVVELLWMLRGLTNTEFLHSHGVTIWDEWADENGDLGPIYGAQWRGWPGAPSLQQHGVGHVQLRKKIDQLANVIEQIKRNPDSRRLIVSAWNPEFVDRMALPPCHTLFQFYVSDGQLSCQLYQRSADLFLGVPFNIASYALLTCIVAHLTGLKPGEFIHTIGDAHIYLNHVRQVEEQLSRDPRPLPTLTITPNGPRHDPADFELEDFVLSGYDPHPAIKGDVSK